MSHQYVISLDCDSPMWLLHRIYEHQGEEVLSVAYTVHSCFGGMGNALRFSTIDDAVDALRDVDESAQLRVVW